MTIDIQQPELEAFIRSRMETGRFQSVEEVLLEALHLSAIHAQPQTSKPRQNLAHFLMNSPLAGSGLCLDRIRDYPRPIDL